MTTKLYDILYLINDSADAVQHDQQWAGTKVEAAKLCRAEQGNAIYIISVKRHADGFNPEE